ncbi:hypothetical protein LCGC14_1130100 [marine sediment metagenome]|uniref:Uncharacterized protein n=1 Tax=marine sediment metagenome TaxID=412755 RepID=A0A0F9PJK1_9ZZZZ
MNTTKEIRCLYCDALITKARGTAWGTFRNGVRADKWFCNERCKGNYHHRNEAPHIHAELERNIHFPCVVCGNLVKINAYGDRTGQRKAMYCGSACKQRAYRSRKREGGADKEVSNAQSWVCQTKDCGQRRFTEPMGDKCSYCGKSDWLAI